MKQKTTLKEIFLVMAAVILISSNVLAFAVSSRYYEGNPLYLQPGGSMETFFTLQNLAGTNDINLKAGIIVGEDIVEIIDDSDTYNVPLGEKAKVSLKITAPIDAKKGDMFPVTLMFTTIVTENESPIAFGGSVGKGFNVVIGEPSDFDENGNLKTNFSWVAYAVIALAIACAAISIFYLRKRRNKKSSKK